MYITFGTMAIYLLMKYEVISVATFQTVKQDLRLSKTRRVAAAAPFVTSS